MTRGLGDRIAGLLLLGLAVWYWWVAGGFQDSFGDPVGPAAFPQLVAIPMGLFAAFLVLRPDADPSWPRLPALGRQLLVLATLLAVPALIETLGFPLTAALGTAVMARILGAAWLAAVTTGLAVGFGLYVIFDPLLGLPLPFAPDLGR